MSSSAWSYAAMTPRVSCLSHSGGPVAQLYIRHLLRAARTDIDSEDPLIEPNFSWDDNAETIAAWLEGGIFTWGLPSKAPADADGRLVVPWTPRSHPPGGPAGTRLRERSDARLTLLATKLARAIQGTA